MIEVKNVTKEFSKITKDKEKITFKADDNISLEVHEGEILGILGPNGAGKTTLLRMISGLMKPTDGTVKIDDLSYKDRDIDIKQRISFLSSNTLVYKNMTPYELMEMCGNYYNMSKEDIKTRIKEIAEFLKINDFINVRIENLSTGQVQRTNIARCIIHDPKYYILDEATSGLDIILSEIILNYIKKEKRKGKGIIYSTHYKEEAENICDRVILIYKGKVIMEGTPDSINKKTNSTNLRESFFKLIGEQYE